MRELFYYYLLYIYNPVKKPRCFCVLALENQGAFSERCSLICGVLQGLVKICKKYMEVNHFLLLRCGLEK